LEQKGFDDDGDNERYSNKQGKFQPEGKLLPLSLGGFWRRFGVVWRHGRV
jgi:hypothetical protein